MLTINNYYEAKRILRKNSNMSPWGMIGGIQGFTNLSFKGLKELVDRRFISESERKNDSPTIGRWIKFVEDNDLQNKLFFHGYIVDIDRDDRRISIEGAQAEGGEEIFTEDQWKALMRISKGASELNKDPYRSWWD